MELHFYKYQGTGNDFILADNREGQLDSLSRDQIARLCHRRFGVGADGLILLNAHADYDFEMKNYNSDGGECSMCGNGARTLVQFACDLGIKKDRYRFRGSDGPHEARIRDGLICIRMCDVREITATPVGSVLNTGSPHLVVARSDLMTAEIVTEGRTLRNSPMFMPGGVNVNFVEKFDQQLFVRTYERGVEDETLSCGTGVIASAIVAHPETGPQHLKVQTRGGSLEVEFNRRSDSHVDEIWLIGPAVKVFTGRLPLSAL
jgi:diaminopimelate epimerase